MVGAEAKEKISRIHQNYLPNKLIAGGISSESLPLLEERFIEGKTFIYVCVDNTCKLPVSEVEDALKLLLK